MVFGAGSGIVKVFEYTSPSSKLSTSAPSIQSAVTDAPSPLTVKSKLFIELDMLIVQPPTSLSTTCFIIEPYRELSQSV